MPDQTVPAWKLWLRLEIFKFWQTSRGMVVFMSFSDAFNAIITSIRVWLISTVSRFYVMPDLINKSTNYDSQKEIEYQKTLVLLT